MPAKLDQELAALPQLTVPQLRRRYAELFGEETHANNKAWLVKRLAWRLQALAEGDLSERARRRAAELANDADLRLGPPKRATAAPTPPLAVADVSSVTPDRRLPPPGSILTRPYKGKSVQVQVLDYGFEYEGVVYRSLSATAKAVTGHHCNGFLFFRLTQEAGQ